MWYNLPDLSRVITSYFLVADIVQGKPGSILAPSYMPPYRPLSKHLPSTSCVLPSKLAIVVGVFLWRVRCVADSPENDPVDRGLG